MCNRHVQQRSALDGNRPCPGLLLTLGPNQCLHHPNLQREIAPAGTCEVGSLEKPFFVCRVAGIQAASVYGHLSVFSRNSSTLALWRHCKLHIHRTICRLVQYPHFRLVDTVTAVLTLKMMRSKQSTL